MKNTMSKNDPILKQMNTRIKPVSSTDSIKLALLVGGVFGFVVGLIVASLLHEYIVHPLGF